MKKKEYVQPNMQVVLFQTKGNLLLSASASAPYSIYDEDADDSDAL